MVGGAVVVVDGATLAAVGAVDDDVEGELLVVVASRPVVAVEARPMVVGGAGRVVVVDGRLVGVACSAGGATSADAAVVVDVDVDVSGVSVNGRPTSATTFVPSAAGVQEPAMERAETTATMSDASNRAGLRYGAKCFIHPGSYGSGGADKARRLKCS